MVSGGGAAAGYFVLLIMVLLAWIWLRVVIRAGRWGASVGERRREDSTVNTDRLKRLDRAAISELLHDDDSANT